MTAWRDKGIYATALATHALSSGPTTLHWRAQLQLPSDWRFRQLFNCLLLHHHHQNKQIVRGIHTQGNIPTSLNIISLFSVACNLKLGCAGPLGKSVACWFPDAHRRCCGCCCCKCSGVGSLPAATIEAVLGSASLYAPRERRRRDAMTARRCGGLFVWRDEMRN